MKKRAFVWLLILCLALAPSALSHSGRTDGKGGHKDNKNASGLGSYHYHCGGNPPHLHTNGACPYGGASQATRKPSATSTARPSQAQATRKPSAPNTARPLPTQAPQPTPRVITIPGELLSEGAEPLFGKTNARDVNIREGATTKSKRVRVLSARGEVLQIIGKVADANDEVWYHIWLDGAEVYIRGDFVDLITQEAFLSGE